ncbi:hypothetical protein GEU84_017610 [Fertoebacter nigrum]|uniref:Uncharacterized protein n=1 Tax=Fertoeibacter niger TaxID=2656921 RepID=A0A8X8H274_9RHOB|nr:hypothetical protein [Fertoeibacter niger]NUB46213.1 hypothetical protein [Fertoeibacter niger]
MKTTAKPVLVVAFALMGALGSPAHANCGGQSNCAEMLLDMERERAAKEAAAARQPTAKPGFWDYVFVVAVGTMIVACTTTDNC